VSKFHEQSWSGRVGRLGDEAEGKFEEIATTGVAPFGLNRPPINLGKVPAVIRYMPDRLQHNRLVECMGIHEDGILKLKVDKLGVLIWWNKWFPVVLFIWDSFSQAWTIQPIDEVNKQCLWMGELKRFPEGKVYYPLNVRDLPWEWEVDRAAAA
jgi:hypothetical protein